MFEADLIEDWSSVTPELRDWSSALGSLATSFECSVVLREILVTVTAGGLFICLLRSPLSPTGIETSIASISTLSQSIDVF